MADAERIKEYDVIVVGSGAAAALCAYTMAGRGRRVAVMADRSSLMHELGETGLGPSSLRQAAEKYEPLRDWLALIGQYEPDDRGAFDPLLVQLAADRYLRERRIDVLFEVRPVRLAEHPSGQELTLAWRGGLHRVRGGYVIDCTQQAALLAPLWPRVGAADEERHVYRTLTTVNNAPFRREESFSFEWGGRTYRIRIEPGRFGGLSIRTAALGCEEDGAAALDFMADLEQIFKRIREQASLSVGDLVHVGEYAWHVPPFQLAGTFSHGIIADGGKLAGTGSWLESIGQKVRDAPLWDKPGVAVREQLIAGVEMALHVV
ncbi:FAD-dependent oxidoreductase [Paenibacillaceae bacterium WGS1546]|uniref:FAD-dependent oxidoreductase n=1 Tax=Cohnella sp. WGS1546 TaxID=3366810 RepID=UPI00372CEB2F